AGGGGGCQLPAEWRPLSEGCRAELAAIIVYARVLALHPDPYGAYNYLPWQRAVSARRAEGHMLAESLSVQPWWHLVSQAEVHHVTSAGEKVLFSLIVGCPCNLCFRMDENYILLPHGVNFQEAIFPDTQENRRMFASLFQFSNCSQAQHVLSFSSDWEIQEDNRLMCSSVQKALFEEEDRVKKLQQKVATLEKRNKQLRDRVKKVKRSLRQARKNTRHMEQMNRKLSEKLSSAGGQIPYINSLKQENSHATYLKV
ncbi:CCDC3 protein, partial [Hemiprocne comata]|nr:CCDC3 protein [Hemiprocne comata]